MQNICLQNLTGKPAAMGSLETSRKFDSNIVENFEKYTEWKVYVSGSRLWPMARSDVRRDELSSSITV